MQELDQFLNAARHLPAPPRIIPELLFLLGRPNVDSSKVGRILGRDAALAEKILLVCNSACFGGANPIADLHEAVTRLGFKQLYQIAAAVGGARVLTTALPGYGLAESELWRHSVTTAVAAQRLAQARGEDESLAFTAGLLHDLGKLVLSPRLQGCLGRLTELIERDHLPLLEAEQKLFQVNHAALAGRMLERWNFPPALVTAVWFHHQPAAATPHPRLAACVFLGNLIALALGRGFGRHAFAVQARPEALTLLGLSPADLPQYVLQVVEQFEVVEALTRIKV
jgi:putative nucleotidyltransferase with HDIG domain